MHARGFAAVNLNRVELHFAAVQMVARQLGNLHRHRHRQGQPHAHVIQHVFQRLVFVLQMVQVLVFEFVRLGNFFRQQAAQGLGQQAFAQGDGIVAAGVFHITADGAAGAAGHGKIQPCRIRLAVGRCDDFHRVARFQFGAQRHGDVVHFRADAAVADVGMNGIGKVNRTRTARQSDDFPFRRNDIRFVGEQIDFDVFQEFKRIVAA